MIIKIWINYLFIIKTHKFKNNTKSLKKYISILKNQIHLLIFLVQKSSYIKTKKDYMQNKLFQMKNIKDADAACKEFIHLSQIQMEVLKLLIVTFAQKYKNH